MDHMMDNRDIEIKSTKSKKVRVEATKSRDSDKNHKRFKDQKTQPGPISHVASPTSSRTSPRSAKLYIKFRLRIQGMCRGRPSLTNRLAEILGPRPRTGSLITRLPWPKLNARNTNKIKKRIQGPDQNYKLKNNDNGQVQYHIQK